GVPERTISRILRRAGEPRLAACDPLTGQVIRASKATAVRYERERPGELIHVDVKSSARSPAAEGGGVAAGPGTRTKPRKKPGLGSDYIPAAVDAPPRLASAEIFPDEKGAPAAAFVLRAAAHFAVHGTPAIERVMTDNAFSYRHSTAFRDA